jgi:predicted nucleic acid-binding protein
MTSAEYFVDAGFWIAWINSRDTWHARARTLGTGLRRPLVTTEAVLLEVGNSLAAAPWRKQVGEFLVRLRSNPNITILPVDSDLAARALELFRTRPYKEWGLTDCVSFVVMEARGITEALAADQHFLQAGFRALLREP